MSNKFKIIVTQQGYDFTFKEYKKDVVTYVKPLGSPYLLWEMGFVEKVDNLEAIANNWCHPDFTDKVQHNPPKAVLPDDLENMGEIVGDYIYVSWYSAMSLNDLIVLCLRKDSKKYKYIGNFFVGKKII